MTPRALIAVALIACVVGGASSDVWARAIQSPSA
jgi:hypothetical protein